MPNLEFAQIKFCEACQKAQALAFENLNIDSGSDEKDEGNAQQMMNEETTEQENHEKKAHLIHLNLIAQTQGEKEKKDLLVIPIMKKMMKAPVNKLTPENGIGVTIKMQ
ncbi:hypothetical protein AgCh_018246 [Apium graveolens]